MLLRASLRITFDRTENQMARSGMIVVRARFDTLNRMAGMKWISPLLKDVDVMRVIHQLVIGMVFLKLLFLIHGGIQ